MNTGRNGTFSEANNNFDNSQITENENIRLSQEMAAESIDSETVEFHNVRANEEEEVVEIVFS